MVFDFLSPCLDFRYIAAAIGMGLVLVEIEAANCKNC